MNQSIKITVIVILVAVLIFLGLVIGYFFSNTPQVKDIVPAMSVEYPNGTGDLCLQKGHICSAGDKALGIKVSLQVNNNTTEEFYVLDDSEEDITLISARNIVDDAIWHIQDTNNHGPNSLLLTLYENTKDWINIEDLTNFEYYDTGYAHYQNRCRNAHELVDNYQCDNLLLGAGYEYIKINNGNIEIQSSYNKKFSYNNHNVKARTVTKEEIEALIEKTDYPISWLENIDPFWTMTSATENTNGYTTKAYVVQRDNSRVSGVTLKAHCVDKYQKIAIRALITIEK